MSFIKYILAIIGAGMLYGSYSLYNGTQDFLSSAERTQGTVIDLIESRSSDSITYAPRVEFTTQDNKTIYFQSSSSSNPPSYSRGEKVEVLYKASTPEDARINGFVSLWLGTIILGVIGLILFLIGASIIFVGASKNKMVKQLKATGTPILADIKEVGLNTMLKVNGKSPYRITAQWLNPKTNELHLFNSDNIWFDPSDYIENEKISVLIDSQDPNKYFMDISFLPKVAK